MVTNAQQRKNSKVITAKILEGLAKELFKEAQRLAPSKSGALKDSAILHDVRKNNNNIVISYTVPYAYTLHEGATAGTIIGDPGQFPWKADTKGHWRRLSYTSIWVRSHTKTYKPYYKPTKSAGGWKAINQQLTSDREGTKWVQKAWDKVLKKQPKNIRDILAPYSKVIITA
tara:strand:- start:4 stop:519 length:516 start_codon:yes stop_codon:yes gene_type:complete